MKSSLPQYLINATPVPLGNRIPWFKSSAPSYFALFFYPFYLNAVLIPMTYASFTVLAAGLSVGCLIAYLWYLAPATRGMKTGFNAYVLTSSCFGSHGALLIALLQAIVQIFYYGVKLYLFAYFLLLFLGLEASVGSIPYSITVIAIFIFSTYFGVAGIKPLALISTLVAPVMIFLLAVTAWKYAPLVLTYKGPEDSQAWGFLLSVDVALSFIAGGAMAGADFGSNNRNMKDVFLGGGVGILLAGLVAAILSLVTVTGFNVFSGNSFTDLGISLQSQGGIISYAVFLVFAIAIIPTSIFSVFLYTNVLTTRIPSLSRTQAGLVCSIIGLLLALTGLATDFRSILNFLGAAFSPVLGVFYAEYYIVSRGGWPGPYQGINIAGYLAWFIGFVVAILPNPLWNVLFGLQIAYAPTNLYAFFASFLGYAIFAKFYVHSDRFIDLDRTRLNK